MKSTGQDLIQQVSLKEEEVRTQTCREMSTWKHREKTAVYKPRREASGETYSTETLISIF